MTTANDIIYLALKTTGVLGLGQTPNTEDLNDAFRILNMMMSQWNRRRWLVYQLVTNSCPANGALYYSVGPGGDFSIVRPDQIESAYFRQNVSTEPNNVDYPLTPLRARENYNEIALKSLGSFPQVYFYESGFPMGHLYVWPLPNNSYTIFITTKVALQSFTSLTDEVELPPEYEEALYTNLAVRLAGPFGIQLQASVVQLAKLSLNTIKNANAQIAVMSMPNDLIQGSLYNIYSDQSY